jgi:DNA polymerase III delta subunit
VLRILAALEAANEPLTLALWQLGEDVHALAAAQAAARTGTPVAASLRSARVWGKRSIAMERAVKRIAPADVDAVLRQLAPLDALAKGIGRGHAWRDLAAAALLLCGRQLRPAA